MSESENENEKVCGVDLIRWTFRAGADNRAAIESHLVDLGLDVMVVGDGEFHVTWEEPDRDADELAAELWEINGEAFEITQEEFYRFSHLILQPDETDQSQAA